MTLQSTQKIIVYYFSGTGNTQIIAKKIVETFKTKGFSTTLTSIEDVDKISILDNEVIGLGFPVAGFSTYPIVFDFIERIGNVNGNYVFAFDTMGGTSLWGIMGKLKTILEKKGCRALLFREFTMPPNLFMKLPENRQKNRIAKSLEQAEKFVDELITGRPNWKKIPIISEVMYHIGRSVFKIAEYKWHQKYLKMKVDISKCTLCGICAAKCPVKNITIGEKTEIGNRCQYCFRCVGICPVGAISGIASPRTLHYLAEGAQF